MPDQQPESAPPVPQTPAPPPEASPEPGVPTMNLLEVETRSMFSQARDDKMIHLTDENF
ncbi:MAG: hypothetical protein QOH79_129 [Acidimicrobiaceae bacterium]